MKWLELLVLNVDGTKNVGFEHLRKQKILAVNTTTDRNVMSKLLVAIDSVDVTPSSLGWFKHCNKINTLFEI